MPALLEECVSAPGPTSSLDAVFWTRRRVFLWGSFVTAKPSPRDLDILLIMGDDFEVERIAPSERAVFDSVQAKLLFEADVFWARASIGDETLEVWLETYQVSRSFRKRGIVELELP